MRYSGPRTGDAVIIGLIDDVRLLDGADGTATLLVVTDDRDLRHGSRLRGRADGRLGVAPRPARRASAVVAIGRESAAGPRRARPVSAASQIDGDPAEMDRPGWKPGRGATTKRGNPRRAAKGGGTRLPKAARTDRMPP